VDTQANNGKNAVPGNQSFSADQLQDLLVQLTGTLRATATQPSGAKEENPLAIARAEYYISQGLSVKFDGSQAQLAPWIKKFKALRNNALWREATYLEYNSKRYDILTDLPRLKNP
jgi:predicted membrane metal-binding protein